MPDYFATTDIPRGIRYDQIPSLIGVIEAPRESAPVGMASLLGQTENGLALWRVQVRGADLPGRWVLVGTWFVPDEG
jgi:hypothetical protein